MLRGDESYGRNSGYYCLLEAFRDVFERGEDRKYGFRNVLAGTADSNFCRQTFLKEVGGGFVNGGPLQLIRPNFFILSQGRCAEALLFSTMSEVLKNKSLSKGNTAGPPALISNGFFDTTSANAAATGFQLHTFTQPGVTGPFPFEQVGKSNPFKGNLDVRKTFEFLSRDRNAARSAMLFLTITNNWAGAQPVSMASIKAAAVLARTHDIPLFFDACRFAENAKLIQDFEDGYSSKTIPQIVQEIFSHVDGFTISLKKDGLANMGGALCFRDKGTFPRKFGADVGIRLKERQIMCYGNDSYGDMSGRDVMAAAVGLYEVTKETYLADRIGQVKRFAEGLIEEGIPVLLPPGGHATFLDMNGFFAGCGRSYGEFASVGFTLELLKDYGIRECEAGPFGWEWDKKGAIAQDRGSIPNLVRFAVPRYVMSDSHIEYTVAAISALHKRRHTIPGAKITRGKELRMRVFQSGLEPVPVASTVNGTASSPTPVTTFWLNEWRSDASLNLCPFEYSVAIERDTGTPQLRFLLEAQADTATLEAYQKSALQLTADIQSKYPQTVSLDRFNAVKDLFFPPASEVEEAAALVAPVTASASKVQNFCSTLSSGSGGPYKGKGPMTCFGFTTSNHGNEVTAESAVYFPVHDYANDDAEVRIQLEKYLSDAGSGQSGIRTLKTYQKAIDAAANRPLQGGGGVQAWDCQSQHTASRAKKYAVNALIDSYADPGKEKSGIGLAQIIVNQKDYVLDDEKIYEHG
ncbi:hypothetical protein LZ31DRAFT_606597 [Colletotrichum somersetense]|nr:hypothetical protein LZ31DRAFT_606597 [Colletotrichum somersetense]